MKITRQNYEAYFIDYLEGSLDEKLVDQFIKFLQKNPDLKKELSLFESVSAVPETTKFSKKDKLYKDKFDVENEFNEAAVANLEGDITTREKREFENYLSSHPEKQNDLKLFSKTLLKADTSITFTNKNKLYKKPKGRVVLFWAGRVAAVLILAFAIFSLLDKDADTVNEVNHFAQVEEKNEQTTTPAIEEKQETESAKTPENTTEKIQEPEVKTQIPPKKDVLPKIETPKNVSESEKSKTELEDIVPKRVPVEVPQKMNSLIASIEPQQQSAGLAPMSLKYIEIVTEQAPVEDERLLADLVKEKTGIDKLSINKIKKAGLNLVSNFTKDNLSYQTNEDGTITEINYDSRLLAFSIPTRKEEADK